MTRRPPRSTLFPYTRSSDLLTSRKRTFVPIETSPDLISFFVTTRAFASRSEEHTSELQSRRELVCRLLLEKKNNHNRPGADRRCHHPRPWCACCDPRRPHRS